MISNDFINGSWELIVMSCGFSMVVGAGMLFCEEAVLAGLGSVAYAPSRRQVINYRILTVAVYFVVLPAMFTAGLILR